MRELRADGSPDHTGTAEHQGGFQMEFTTPPALHRADCCSDGERCIS